MITTLKSLTRTRRELYVPIGKLGADVARLGIRLKRPTLRDPLDWHAESKLRVSLVCEIDGVEYRCVGEVSGGVRIGVRGSPLPYFRLRYALPYYLGEQGMELVYRSSPDERGYYHNIPTNRIGFGARSVKAYALVESLTGDNVEAVIEAWSVSAVAPLERVHNSVAFDAATSAEEVAGDGVLSLSHTSTGADRGVWGAQAAYGAATSTSISYAGSGLTERSDQARNNLRLGAYSGKGQTTGAQTVTGTFSASVDEHALAAISLTGVDQTTEVSTATAAGANGAASPATVTALTVGSDDMVVDTHVSDFDAVASAGADQTERFTQDIDGVRTFKGSTQAGTAGGVMSWTLGGTSIYGEGWITTAIAFKAAGGGGGGGSAGSPLLLLGVG